MLRSTLICSLLCVNACGDNLIPESGDGGIDGHGQPGGDAGNDASLDVAPTVTGTVPADGALGVSLATFVSATFDQPMKGSSITMTTFTLMHGATTISGAVALDAPSNTATFTPAVALDPSVAYTATITVGATNSAGLALATSFVWSFTTAANANPPTIVSTTPANLALGASVSQKPTATFNKAMNPATLTTQTFTLKQGATAIVGVVTLDGATNTARFAPAAALGLGLVYTATITTGAKDTGGLALAADRTWSFTTGACSQSSVDLLSAARFAVLAGSTVTNTGSSSVTGDVGVSPGTAITGFPPGSIIGAKHAGDAVAAQGIADLTVAYNNAALRVLCPISVAGDLGGQTLAPGLYKSTSSLAITVGDLTLDAGGDADAVFIFQMASTLTVSDGRHLILTNGASSANIFWQVGTAATLGTTSSFAGTIMADQAVALATGATLNGRALARIAAVTLQGNTIVKPAP